MAPENQMAKRLRISASMVGYAVGRSEATVQETHSAIHFTNPINATLKLRLSLAMTFEIFS
jgi:hypothetical protein